jgi:hypothetical protein
VLKGGMRDLRGDDGANGAFVQHDQQRQPDRHRDLPAEQSQKPPLFADRSIHVAVDHQRAP